MSPEQLVMSSQEPFCPLLSPTRDIHNWNLTMESISVSLYLCQVKASQNYMQELFKNGITGKDLPL